MRTIVELQSVDAFWLNFSGALGGRRWALAASREGHRRWAGLAPATGLQIPDRKLVADTAELECAQEAPEVLVAFGGGAVIDFAKLTAYRMGQHGDAFRPPPIIAIPTIAGSGSERTQFATVWTTDGKSSVEHPDLRPETVMLVPDFALTVPHDVATISALDALSHALECVWNRNATPESDTLAAAAIPVIVEGIQRLNEQHVDHTTVGLLMKGSSWAGQAIALTRTALAHSISYPLTAQLGIPHGLASSFALAEIARFNLKEASRIGILTRAFKCSAELLPCVIEELLRKAGVGSSLRLPSLAELHSITMQMTASPRAANNIRPATEIQAREIARMAVKALKW